ncbi:hypothetical protein ACFE04_027230 [Oxalis oulophora]
MSEGGVSRYVKLTKDQEAPLDDIRPGELNQPIDVPQLNVRKCNECGQPLPEDFAPPSDEPWTTGIFGCAEDTESCWTGLFCPCVLFGRNVERLKDDEVPWTTPCICHGICIEGGLGLAAATAIFHGINPGTSFLICEGLLFAWWMCGIYTGLSRQNLQKKYHLKEHREMKNRLSDNFVMPITMVNPPTVQEMNSGEAHHHPDRPTSNQNGTTLEMQPL